MYEITQLLMVFAALWAMLFTGAYTHGTSTKDTVHTAFTSFVLAAILFGTGAAIYYFFG